MKDPLGHGSNGGKGGKVFKPIPGHPYHSRTDAELRYIAKDAAEAGRNAHEMGDMRGVNKYADQVADASTVLGYRSRGGKSDAVVDQLHSGTSKSNPAPVHDAFSSLTPAEHAEMKTSSAAANKKFGDRLSSRGFFGKV